MPILLLKRDITDTASAKASSGWHACMNKTACKYPAILAIILAIGLALLAAYCLFRCLSCCCCDCLSGGRYQRRKARKHHKYADLHASPYAPPGYHQQQQQQPLAPYNQPPQYAQFEHSREGGNGDALPRMPVWGEGAEKRVYDDHHQGDGDSAGRRTMKTEKEVEAAYEREQRVPMLAAEPAPRYEESRMDASPAGDLGGGQQGYRPFGAAYVPYSASAWGGGGAGAGGGDGSVMGQGQGQGGKGWRDV